MMRHYFYYLLMSCFLLCACGNGSSSKNEGNNQRETEILDEMEALDSERQSLANKTEKAYNEYRYAMSGVSDALLAQRYFLELRQCQRQMEWLCNRFLELARELGDEEILQETQMMKRRVMQSYDNMFAEIGAD